MNTTLQNHGEAGYNQNNTHKHIISPKPSNMIQKEMLCKFATTYYCEYKQGVDTEVPLVAHIM